MQTQSSPATEIAAALAAQAEAVCRHYLPAGKREGRYWIVGDVHGSRGSSLFVRLRAPGQPGKWNDAATGEHGDLLDIVRRHSGTTSLSAALAEARAFLALPTSRPAPTPAPQTNEPLRRAARRLWHICHPIDGTHAEAYLKARGIENCRHPSLRFHPSLYYRERNITRQFPALVAAVTDPAGRITGVHRTYLDPSRPAKAKVATSKKALGDVIGSTVRFASASPDSCLIVGEGIETVLSLLTAFPAAAGAATLSAAGLGAFSPPSDRRIAIGRDRGNDGNAAAMRLAERCMQASVRFRILPPCLEDFNDDLVAFGPDGIRRGLSAA